MLKINVLVSSMNWNFKKNKKLFIKHPGVSYIIINQITNSNFDENIEIFSDRDDIKIYNYHEKGLSKSRNRALSHVDGDICIIADDDIFYQENIFEILRERYQLNPSVSAITFQDSYAEVIGYKKYIKKEYFHTRFTAMKVTSFEISFRSNIIQLGLTFDERFGLGSQIPLGEENIFLCDVIEKKLKVLHIPEFLVNHPQESTGCAFNEGSAFKRGVVFARIFKNKIVYLIDIFFGFKKRKKLDPQISMNKYIRVLITGSSYYFRKLK